MVIASAGGPSWTDIMTAFGTVGAVIVAVGIALWTERRSDRRLREERGRSDQVLAEQQKQAKAAIEDERAHGRAQLDEERRIAREREQLAQAYAVQVAVGQRVERNDTAVNERGDPEPADVYELAVFIVNKGAYTITRVEAQFCLGNSMIQPHATRRQSNLAKVPASVRGSFQPSAERAMRGVLTPFDEGISFETDKIHERHLVSPYPVVRWVDQWGTWWEHKRGVVWHIADGEPWQP